MRTLVLDPQPAELEQLLERRRRLGLDLYDEVWEGTYHMSPAAHPHHGYVDDQMARVLGPCAETAGLVGTGPFNLGTPEDYRVPDRGYHRQLPSEVFVPTAVVVVEVVSPGDETYDKLDFYAAHEVDEVIIVDPRRRSAQVLLLGGGRYEDAERSPAMGGETDLVRRGIRWP